MQLVIACAGSLKNGPCHALVDDFVSRSGPLARQTGFRGLSVHEIDAPKSLPPARKQAREAELLAAAVPDGAAVFILDERGKSLGSAGFAQTLGGLRDSGLPAAAFLIGGADGHGQAVRALVQSHDARLLSFGPATWPHMLVRAMLAEQIYRALTILAGHPYHRA